MVTIGNQGGPEHLLRRIGDHRLGEIHDVVKISVSLVQLQHREFGIVPGGQALVAEIPVISKTRSIPPTSKRLRFS